MDECGLDTEALAQIAVEAFRELGRVVVTLCWGGDSPGHSGSNTVIEWRDHFLVETETDTYGPYQDLDEALALDVFHYAGTPHPELTCSPGIAENGALIAAARDLAGASGETVVVNGQRFLWIGDALIPGP